MQLEHPGGEGEVMVVVGTELRVLAPPDSYVWRSFPGIKLLES